MQDAQALGLHTWLPAHTGSGPLLSTRYPTSVRNRSLNRAGASRHDRNRVRVCDTLIPLVTIQAAEGGAP